MKYVYVPIYARNAILSDSTKNILVELESLATNNTVKKWVAGKLKKYLIEEYGSEIYQHENEHNHPAWVKEALANGETVYYVSVSKGDYEQYKEYVSFLNTVPQKQVTGLSVEDVSKRYASFVAKRDADKIEGVKTVYKFSNGYRVVELVTEKAVQLESRRMANCLVRHNYWDKIQKGTQRHFSLRDKRNDPHVLIEYNVANRKIGQIKGYANEQPNKRYFPMLVEFLEFLQANHLCGDYIELGIVFVNGQLTTLEDALPKGLELDSVILPVSYGIRHPDVGDIKTRDEIYTNYFTCNSVGNFIAKNQIVLSEFCCHDVSSFQAPTVILANSDIERVGSILSEINVIIRSNSRCGTIDNLSCVKASMVEKTVINRINKLTAKQEFGINRSNIEYLGADYIKDLAIESSTVNIHWKNVERCTATRSNITLLNSNTKQNLLLRSCNTRLQNSKCNSITIANSKESRLLLDENSNILSLSIAGTLDKRFLQQIKKYSQRIGQIASELDNRDAIEEAGFKFKLLKQGIKARVEDLGDLDFCFGLKLAELIAIAEEATSVHLRSLC